MNRGIATTLAVVGSLLTGPAALAATEPAPAAGYDLESVGDGILVHGEADDHDHHGDGRPDHDPEDHDEDANDKKSDDDD